MHLLLLLSVRSAVAVAGGAIVAATVDVLGIIAAVAANVVATATVAAVTVAAVDATVATVRFSVAGTTAMVFFLPSFADNARRYKDS